MKKTFVGLVLTLVIVLGLNTVVFAHPNSGDGGEPWDSFSVRSFSISISLDYFSLDCCEYNEGKPE